MDMLISRQAAGERGPEADIMSYIVLHENGGPMSHLPFPAEPKANLQCMPVK